MDVLAAIESRRAVKRFDPEHRMSQDEIDMLMDLARRSPTAFNIQNWRFVVVRDTELRGRIREVSWNQAQVTDASLLVAICADLKAWDRDPARYWRNAPEAVRERLVPAIGGYFRDNEQAQRDEAFRSCGIAAQTIMLAARSMNYETCPMSGFDPEKVGSLIGLPEDHLVCMLVTVGKGVGETMPRGGDIPREEAVISNRFPES